MARRHKTYSSDIDIPGSLEKCLGGVLQGMTGEERGKILYSSMKTVMSRLSPKVRSQVLATRLKVTADQVKNAVWSYANGVSGRMGIKVRPGKRRNADKGKVPVKRKPGWKLPILLWAVEGTGQRTTKKGANRGKMHKEKYNFLRNKEVIERQAMDKLPQEVDRRVNKWIEKKLNY